MHSQLAGGAAPVALVLLQHREYELLFEFTDCFLVEDAAPVHLHD